MLELTEELIRASAVASTGSAQVMLSTACVYRICRAEYKFRTPGPGHSKLLFAALAVCWPQLTPCCPSMDVHPFCGWGQQPVSAQQGEHMYYSWSNTYETFRLSDAFLMT